MRVIAGTARSLKLKAPEGMQVRPTLDRTKETLFNMLGSYIPDCVFVDIFSGSGAIGIEALSRGAKKSFFIENDKNALSVIRENLEYTKLKDKSEILAMDYMAAISELKTKAIKPDIIFIDPPFYKDLEEKTILQIINCGILNDSGIIICESGTNTSWDFIKGIDTVSLWKEKKFKTSKFTFLIKK